MKEDIQPPAQKGAFDGWLALHSLLLGTGRGEHGREAHSRLKQVGPDGTRTTGDDHRKTEEIHKGEDRGKHDEGHEL